MHIVPLCIVSSLFVVIFFLRFLHFFYCVNDRREGVPWKMKKKEFIFENGSVSIVLPQFILFILSSFSINESKKGAKFSK